MPISSTRNPSVKFVRSLGSAAHRRREGLYLAEGVRLVAEAVHTEQRASLVLCDPAALLRSEAGSRLLAELPRWAERVLEVDARVLAVAAQTETPSGVIAVLHAPDPPKLESFAGARWGLLLDGLADPGNAGTILRTAAAFGVSYVLTSPASTDLFAPKVVRAGMGAHFLLPLYPQVPAEQWSGMLPEVEPVAAEALGGEPLPDFRWPSRSLLVIGSEAAGLSPPVLPLIRHTVHIPMRGAVESLNAASAASILLYAGPGSALTE